jgi:hypothetical protein
VPCLLPASTDFRPGARLRLDRLLTIDNNAAEREMKLIAIGRNNWLTVGSPHGGQTAAGLFSFMSMCQHLGVEPWAYLQDVLPRSPVTPAGHLGDFS